MMSFRNKFLLLNGIGSGLSAIAAYAIYLNYVVWYNFLHGYIYNADTLHFTWYFLTFSTGSGLNTFIDWDSAGRVFFNVIVFIIGMLIITSANRKALITEK